MKNKKLDEEDISEIAISNSALKVLMFLRSDEPERPLAEKVAILKSAVGTLEAIMGMKSASILMQNYLNR